MATRYNYTRVTYVDPFPGQDASEVVSSEPCFRCWGQKGAFQHYRDLNGGECFRCSSDPDFREITTVGDARKAAKREVNRVNKARLEAAKELLHFEAGIAAAAAIRPEWNNFPQDAVHTDEGDDFLSSLSDQLRKGRELSEKQVQAGADAIDRWWRKEEVAAAAAAAKAATPAITEGRMLLEGTIASIKDREGFNGTEWKMIVELANGQRVWGTFPQSLWDALMAEGSEYNLDKARGRQVSLTATVTPSRDDHTFGFFKRPTKAQFTN